MSDLVRFIRYPGGKRRMLNFLSQHLPAPNSIQGRYAEPFVGSGAVFLFLAPQSAWLSDINPDLIDLYRGVRKSPQAVWERYCAFGENKTEYQRVRDAGPSGLLVDRAARVLFLNRTCFKGMWRHNRDGHFNVGYGGQARRWVINREMLSEVARALRRATLQCSDFEDVVDECEVGDFLFLDPPYRPGEKEQINDHYVGQQFSYEDHLRLSSALRRAKKRGVHWALTTSAHPDIVRLFRGNELTAIPRGTGRSPGVLAANSGELLITSYKMERKIGYERLLQSGSPAKSPPSCAQRIPGTRSGK
jgi:DNA adenine methylase